MRKRITNSQTKIYDERKQNADPSTDVTNHQLKIDDLRWKYTPFSKAYALFIFPSISRSSFLV